MIWVMHDVLGSSIHGTRTFYSIICASRQATLPFAGNPGLCLALQQLLVLGLVMSGMALKVVITCPEAEDSIRRVDVP
jgi:hypothetical protein